jgi:hypothetical protein
MASEIAASRAGDDGGPSSSARSMELFRERLPRVIFLVGSVRKLFSRSREPPRFTRICVDQEGESRRDT